MGLPPSAPQKRGVPGTRLGRGMQDRGGGPEDITRGGAVDTKPRFSINPDSRQTGVFPLCPNSLASAPMHRSSSVARGPPPPPPQMPKAISLRRGRLSGSRPQDRGHFPGFTGGPPQGHSYGPHLTPGLANLSTGLEDKGRWGRGASATQSYTRVWKPFHSPIPKRPSKKRFEGPDRIPSPP